MRIEGARGSELCEGGSARRFELHAALFDFAHLMCCSVSCCVFFCALVVVVWRCAALWPVVRPSLDVNTFQGQMDEVTVRDAPSADDGIA
jgi:hypothetical protein